MLSGVLEARVSHSSIFIVWFSPGGFLFSSRVDIEDGGTFLHPGKQRVCVQRG